MLSIPSAQSTPNDKTKLKKAFTLVFIFTILLWLIELAKFLFNLPLYQLGVHPQQFSGLIGIITAPLIHDSFEHLISNTPAILILGTALIYGYPRSSWKVLIFIWLVSEMGVWFTARPVFHYGASGLTYGAMAFIFAIGVLRRDKIAITLSLLVFFLYGSMIWGLFPHQAGISFETHLWGAGTGILCAFIFRNVDPPAPVKRYSWEIENEQDPHFEDYPLKNESETTIENDKKSIH